MYDNKWVANLKKEAESEYRQPISTYVKVVDGKQVLVKVYRSFNTDELSAVPTAKSTANHLNDHIPGSGRVNLDPSKR